MFLSQTYAKDVLIQKRIQSIENHFAFLSTRSTGKIQCTSPLISQIEPTQIAQNNEVEIGNLFYKRIDAPTPISVTLSLSHTQA